MIAFCQRGKKTLAWLGKSHLDAYSEIGFHHICLGSPHFEWRYYPKSKMRFPHSPASDSKGREWGKGETQTGRSEGEEAETGE